MGTWEVADHAKDMSILQSTSAFKLKCFTDGPIKLFKAWFHERGDQQIDGNDFFETFSHYSIDNSLSNDHS